jgi:hypothetical protein
VLLAGRLPKSDVTHQDSSDKPRGARHFHDETFFHNTIRPAPTAVGLEDELAAYLTDASGCGVGRLTKLAAVRIANHSGLCYDTDPTGSALREGTKYWQRAVFWTGKNSLEQENAFRSRERKCPECRLQDLQK